MIPAGKKEEQPMQPTEPAPTVKEKAREGLLAAKKDGTLERIAADTLISSTRQFFDGVYKR